MEQPFLQKFVFLRASAPPREFLFSGSTSPFSAKIRWRNSSSMESSVAGEEPSGKIGDNFARTAVLKKHRGILTLCLARVGSFCV